MEKTAGIGGADGPAGAGSSGPKWNAAQSNEERKKMTKQELAKMSLESLLYYVLVGERRRSL